VFSSAGAIAAVRAFVLDRLLLGGTGVLPEGTAAALQLVEDGKAYAVDWGWFVWAFLMSDVLVGKPRRCGRYLLRLMRCKRPDLFSEVDGRFVGKRRKVLILPQEDEKPLHGNGIYDQPPMAAEAEVEEKSVSGPSKNTGKKPPASGGVKDQQHTIETEDQEDGSHCNANAAPSLPSFYSSRQQVLAHFSNMENALLDKERTLSRTRAEIQRMKEEEEEKDNEIACIVEEIEEELQARHTKINQLEHDRMLMRDILHGCKEMLRESSAAFLEYRKAMCEGSGVSSLDAVANEKNQLRLMQQQWQARERIVNGFQKPMLLKVTACAKKIAVLLPKLVDLSNEVQRLKGSRSIPDLNVGPHL
jgi:vacuolar-type H+-ATPase subunit D/Vma8